MHEIDAAIPILAWRAWAAALVVYGCAYLAGSLVCMRITTRATTAANVDLFLIRFTVGLALLPLAVLGAGQVDGLLFRLPWAISGIAGVVWFGFHLFDLRRARAEHNPVDAPDSPALSRKSSFDLSRVLGVAGWAAVAITLLVVLGRAFSPPINYDVLEYHLGVIPHFFEIGTIEPIPHVFYSAQPIATELLYTLGSVVEGTPWGGAHGLVHWGLIVIAALAMGRCLTAVGCPAATRSWLVVLFLTHPIVRKMTLDRMTDLTGAVFMMGGLLAWFGMRGGGEASGRDRLRSALLIGLLAGGAISAKWTNAGTAGAILGLLAIVASVGRPRTGSETEVRGRFDGRSGAGFHAAFLGLAAAGVAVVMIPWCAYLWRGVGNPFAPFAAGLFPTEAWGAGHLAFLMETHGATSPFRAEYWPNLFGRLNSFSIGPPVATVAVVILLADSLLRRRGLPPRDAAAEAGPDFARHSGPPAAANTRLVFALAGGIAIGCLTWGRLLHAADRFLVPIVAAQFIMLGVALARVGAWPAALWSRHVRAVLGPAAAAAFALWIMIQYWAPLMLSFGGYGFWDVALGRETEGEFNHRLQPSNTEFFGVVNALPDEARPLVIAEARRFVFTRPVVLSSVFDRSPVFEAIAEGATSASIRAALKQLGYTHLVVNEHEIARLLSFHPPPVLAKDKGFANLRGDYPDSGSELVRRYSGYVEFGPEQLDKSRRAPYAEMLGALRAEAIYISAPPAGYPAFWIARL